MNKLVSLAGAIVVSILFSCCNTTKGITNYNLQGNPPFKVVNSSYQEWVSGQSDVRGAKVYIKTNTSKIQLDSIYFRNMKAALEFDDVSQEYIGHFTFPNTKTDIIIHSDSTQEYGNQVPDISQKIPFKLANNEAVLSYIYKNEKYFYKISNLQKTPTQNTSSN
jgi:hypothetical protein